MIDYFNFFPQNNDLFPCYKIKNKLEKFVSKKNKIDFAVRKL